MPTISCKLSECGRYGYPIYVKECLGIDPRAITIEMAYVMLIIM
jgi:hypothetical protein